MKIVSIEPTPSPNSMKLNMDESLPQGEMYNITDKNKEEAPEYLQQLLQIEGVRGVYQVTDFIAIERNPRIDWKIILPQARDIFGATDYDSAALEALNSPMSDDSFKEIKVEVQMFRGLPMQVKLTSGTEEQRVGLPQRFMDAAMKAEPASVNMVMERKWEEQDVRYGEMEEVGQQVVEEISAAYDAERLQQLVERAFQWDEGEVEKEELSLYSIEEMLQKMEDPDWKKRYAMLERMPLDEKHLPVLERALEDEKMSIRRLGTAYLGEIENEASLNLLYKALKDQAVAVRRTAGDALSDLADPSAQEAMMEALRDKNKLVRWRAARFLYEVGDEKSVPALRKAENDPEFEVSLQAKIALARIEGGEEAEGSVWQQMTDNFRKS